MQKTNKTVELPGEWGVKADFVSRASGDCMTEFGITDGMLLFLQEAEKYRDGDIVYLDSKEWEGPSIKRVKILSSGLIIFYSARGDIIEYTPDVKIEGRMVFKMDDPFHTGKKGPEKPPFIIVPLIKEGVPLTDEQCRILGIKKRKK